MAEITCVVVTPEKTELEDQFDFVALPLFDGEIGIGAGRTPLIGRLGYGEMRLKRGAETSRFYLDGGFVQVSDNTVTVLTNRAVESSALDYETVNDQLAEARERKANTPELLEIRDRLVSQARAQLRVIRRAK